MFTMRVRLKTDDDDGPLLLTPGTHLLIPGAALLPRDDALIDNLRWRQHEGQKMGQVITAEHGWETAICQHTSNPCDSQTFLRCLTVCLVRCRPSLTGCLWSQTSTAASCRPRPATTDSITPAAARHPETKPSCAWQPAWTVWYCDIHNI